MSTLTYKLSADDRELIAAMTRTVEGFKTADRHAKAVGTSAAAAGGAITRWGGAMAGILAGGAAVAGFKSYTEQFARLGDLSERLNITGESMQRLNYIAGQGGVDVEVMAKALTKMTATLGGNDAAAAKASSTLYDLGINAEAFKKMSPDKQLVELSKAFEKGGGNGETFAGVLDLIGAKGADLIPTLRQGSEAIANMAAQAPIVSEQNLDAIKRYDDAIQSLTATCKAAMGPVVGFISRVITTDIEAVKAFKESGFNLEKFGQILSDKAYGKTPFAPGEEVLGPQIFPMRSVNDRANLDVLKRQMPDIEEGVKNRIDFLKAKADLAKSNADELGKQEDAIFNVTKTAINLSNKFKNPLDRAINERAQAIGSETDTNDVNAMRLSRMEASAAAKDAVVGMRRHTQLSAQRIEKNLSREGLRNERAKAYLDKIEKGGQGNMDAIPLGARKSIEEIKKAREAAREADAKKVRADQDQKKAEADLRQAQKEMMEAVKDIKDAVSAKGGGDSIQPALKTLRDNLTKF